MSTIPTKLKCKHCGGETFTLKSNNIHLGLYCSQCGKWAKWISHKEVGFYKQYIVPGKQPVKEPTKNPFLEEFNALMSKYGLGVEFSQEELDTIIKEKKGKISTDCPFNF